MAHDFHFTNQKLTKKIPENEKKKDDEKNETLFQSETNCLEWDTKL